MCAQLRAGASLKPVMDQYLPILLLLVLALLFAVGSFMASRMLGPNGRLDPAKRGPYEWGIAPCGSRRLASTSAFTSWP